MSNSSEIYDRYRKNRTQDVVNIAFLLFISVIFPIYMHNKYFDITVTRATVFTDGVIFYLVLIASSMAIEFFMLNYYSAGCESWFYKDSKVIAMPDVWMLLFLAANVMAFFMAPNKEAAWTGSEGRRFGLAMILAVSLMFIFLARETCVNLLVFLGICISAAATDVIAILQHFGYDPFDLRLKVIDKQKSMFISLFGNINTYSSYIAMVLPIFVAVYVFEKKKWVRIISSVFIILTSAAIIPGKSDNVYLGLFAAFLVLFYISISQKKIFEYVFAILLISVGLFAMSVLNEEFKGSQGHINGIAENVQNPKIMFAFAVLMFVISAFVFVLKIKNNDLYFKIQSFRLMIICSVIFVVLLVGFIIYGVKAGLDLFQFNDKWGTYRGYIWRRGFDLFEMAPLKNKIFGYGNETIGRLMRANFYNEMVGVTGKKYDNCHNELLQYLVTTGIFGAVSYIGLFVSSIIYMLKRNDGNAIVIASIGAAVAYAAQGLVNLNQPITTPFYFVILAAGIGFIRY